MAPNAVNQLCGANAVLDNKNRSVLPMIACGKHWQAEPERCYEYGHGGPPLQGESTRLARILESIGAARHLAITCARQHYIT